MAKVKNILPKGWDEERVRRVLAHYENQTDDQAVAEDEAAFGRGETTVMEIPTAIIPDVLALIASHAQRERAVGKSVRRRKSA